MATNYPVNPRVRAYGKARIDIARRAASPSDWERLWKPSTHPFPFRWGQPWNACVEYRVDDFAAEVGFFIDVLGFPVNAFDPDYAMLTSPGGDFFFAITPARPGESATPPDALRLQFMVIDILDTTRELISRGIFFEQEPQPCQEGSSLYIGYFRTPHGICIDLWGVVGEEMDVEIETEEPGSIAYTDFPTARIHETLREITPTAQNKSQAQLEPQPQKSPYVISYGEDNDDEESDDNEDHPLEEDEEEIEPEYVDIDQP
jgi:catechol 2,3-dioxygenase-like lactoylglutathione lyase family enzyme